MRAFIIIGTLALLGVGYIVSQNTPPARPRPQASPSGTIYQKPDRARPRFTGEVDKSIFVPYWDIPSVSDDISEYDTLIYFGVAPRADGSLKLDAGHLNIGSFMANTSDQHKRLLTIRMLDDAVSLEVLTEDSRQKTVVSESLDLAKQYGFDGIVLDLELGVIPFSDMKSSITKFVALYASEVKEADMTFSITIYGDVFYRARPYDVKALGALVDRIYIMAYDFHKSRGEPGPNFPFNHLWVVSKTKTPPEGVYDYSFQEMIDDFTNIMSPERLTIVFGIYGYDWTLGEQGLPLKQAAAIPLKEIESGMQPYCDVGLIPFFLTPSPKGAHDIVRKKISSPTLQNCMNYSNDHSKEKHITYTDEEGYNHELWYEDMESVDVKIEYLKEQGIGNVGYWVWGYF